MHSEAHSVAALAVCLLSLYGEPVCGLRWPCRGGRGRWRGGALPSCGTPSLPTSCAERRAPCSRRAPGAPPRRSRTESGLPRFLITHRVSAAERDASAAGRVCLPAGCWSLSTGRGLGRNVVSVVLCRALSNVLAQRAPDFGLMRLQGGGGRRRGPSQERHAAQERPHHLAADAAAAAADL